MRVLRPVSEKFNTSKTVTVMAFTPLNYRDRFPFPKAEKVMNACAVCPRLWSFIGASNEVTMQHFVGIGLPECRPSSISSLEDKWRLHMDLASWSDHGMTSAVRFARASRDWWSR
eukprot:6488169-Amphidinium_carterae.1